VVPAIAPCPHEIVAHSSKSAIRGIG